ncbi:MAG: hypothetical protein RMX98_029525, partial [Nostoc sp. DedQUE02]
DQRGNRATCTERRRSESRFSDRGQGEKGFSGFCTDAEIITNQPDMILLNTADFKESEVHKLASVTQVKSVY